MVVRAVLAALLALLATPFAHADALSDAKAVLHRLGGQQPIKATIELRRSRHSSGRFLNDSFDGSAVVDVELDANSLRTRWSRALLERAEEEEWTRGLDPNRAAATWETLSEAAPVPIDDMIDSGKILLRLLARGSVVAQRVEGADRVVVLRIPATGKASGDRVTYVDDVLTLWVGRDGTPARATRLRKGTAGMLFIHVDLLRTESWTYAVRGDHLVAMRSEDASTVNGPGQHGDARTTWTARSVE
jgi:hypothetical protein